MATKQYRKLTDLAGKGVAKLLGELELEIMCIAWAHQTVTVRDVLDVLASTRPLAYTTIMTIMGRLVDKGLLATEKQGKTFCTQKGRQHQHSEDCCPGNPPECQSPFTAPARQR